MATLAAGLVRLGVEKAQTLTDDRWDCPEHGFVPLTES